MKNGYLKEFIRVISLLSKRKFTYFVTIFVTCFAYPCMNILFSFAYKRAVNAIEFRDSSLLINTCILFLIAIFIQCILEPFANYRNAIIVNKTLFDVRCKLFQHTVNLPVSYFESHHSGDLMLRLSSNIDALEPIYRGSFRDMMQSIFYGVGALISMIVIHIKLAFCALIFSGFTFFANKLFTNRLKQLNDRKQEDYAALNQSFVRSYSAGHTARIFGKVSILLTQFQTANQRLKISVLNIVKKQIEKETLTEVIRCISNLVLFIYGLCLVRSHQSDVGSILAVISLQGGLTGMFTSLGGFFANMQGNLANVRRVFELLDEKVEVQQYSEQSKTSNENGVIISFHHVNFSYDQKKQAIRDINLTIREHEFVAIVGQNGSGKSTLMKLLLGFYQPEGSILFENQSCENHSLSEIRDIIAYVPQKPVLFDDTILENIRYGRPEASEEEVIQAAKMANIHEFILTLENGYETLVGENGAYLSGGQKQRIAIARAFLKNSPIILLDEATSALDANNEAEVMDTILQIVGKRTILMITHRLSTISCANQILFMKEGRIVESGTHNALMEIRGEYKKLYEMQAVAQI